MRIATVTSIVILGVSSAALASGVGGLGGQLTTNNGTLANGYVTDNSVWNGTVSNSTDAPDSTTANEIEAK